MPFVPETPKAISPGTIRFTVSRINAQDSANINIVHGERQFEPSGDSVSQNNHDFAVLKPFIKAKYGRGVSALNYAYKATDRKLKYEQFDAGQRQTPGTLQQDAEHPNRWR
jgi:hypothetical protein